MAVLSAVVLAGGKGSRMGGERPKVLYPAAGRTLLEWVLPALSDAGVTDTVCVVGFQKEAVIAQLPTGVRWVGQEPQLGTGHAVWCARDAFQGPARTGPLVVACGDMPLVRAETYRRLVGRQRETGAAAVILTTPVPPDSHFGRIVRDAGGGVRRIVEWKDADAQERAITEGNAGVYCFGGALFWDALTLENLGNATAQGEYYLTDIVPLLLARGGWVDAISVTDPAEALGVNTPEDLARAEAELARRG